MDKRKSNIIGDLFFLRNLAHLRHLYTSSYAEHVALEEFYVSLLPLTDQLAEIMQKHNVGNIVIYSAYTDMIEDDNRLQIYFNAFKEKFEEVNFNLTRAENNIIDDILSLIDQTLYKLNNLV
jgi:hypothetical protein